MISEFSVIKFTRNQTHFCKICDGLFNYLWNIIAAPPFFIAVSLPLLKDFCSCFEFSQNLAPPAPQLRCLRHLAFLFLLMFYESLFTISILYLNLSKKCFKNFISQLLLGWSQILLVLFYCYNFFPCISYSKYTKASLSILVYSTAFISGRVFQVWLKG